MTRDPLLELCRDRALITPELHAPNDFYGHASLLKRYAGLPGREPLKVAIEHGVPLNGSIWEVDLRSEMNLFLCSGAAHARDYERQAGGGKRAIPIGPLYRYAPETRAPEARERCLVAFPAHSSHRVRAVFDQRAFADEIERVGREFDAVVVCVYWKDVLGGGHLPYRERGFECVSAGHMFDPEFLPRLFTILRRAALVLTNDFGTHILMATAMGRPVALHRTDVRFDAREEVLAVDAPSYLDHPDVQRLQRLFADVRSEPSEEQRRFVDDLFGVEHVRSPRELRDILDQAEQEYRRRLTPARRLRNAVRKGWYYGQVVEVALRSAVAGVASR